MGRGKLSLNLMLNPKSRSSTFKKRKSSLVKKAYELSTLCDVRTCVLIHGPGSAPHEDRSQSDSAFHTWPPNRSEVEGMIRAYKNTCVQKRKCLDLYDFFSDRKRKIETETSKVRENVEEVLCPKWDERLECLSEYQLREFMDGLDSKIEAASGMIDFMEANYDHLFVEEALPLPEFSLEDEQDIVQMVRDWNRPVTPLVQLDFPDLSIGLNGDQIEYNFEHLPLLLEEENGNDLGQYTNLMNYEFDYCNNIENLMMAGNF